MAGSMAPGLLVAAPSLRCPFFNHTLVLLVDHGEDGSFGFVINKPSDVRFRQVLDEMGFASMVPKSQDAPVMVGGPVSVEAGWIVFDPSECHWPKRDSIQIDDRLAVSASVDMLKLLATGKGPSRRLMTLGYAGWGPGQLEAEMAEGSWIPVDLDPTLVFEAPVDSRWSMALGSLGIDPGCVAVQQSMALA